MWRHEAVTEQVAREEAASAIRRFRLMKRALSKRARRRWA